MWSTASEPGLNYIIRGSEWANLPKLIRDQSNHILTSKQHYITKKDLLGYFRSIDVSSCRSRQIILPKLPPSGQIIVFFIHTRHFWNMVPYVHLRCGGRIGWLNIKPPKTKLTSQLLKSMELGWEKIFQRTDLVEKTVGITNSLQDFNFV